VNISQRKLFQGQWSLVMNMISYRVQIDTPRLTHFGNMTRMGSDRYLHLLLHGYTHGHSPKGRPKKKWSDNIRDDCIEMGIITFEASQLAINRTRWRNTICHVYYILYCMSDNASFNCVFVFIYLCIFVYVLCAASWSNKR